MKKSSFLLLICAFFVILLGLFGNASAEISGSNENITYTLNDEGLLIISGTGEITNCLWFDHLYDVKQVIIENGITGIGSQVFFNHFYLSDISIPNSVTSIGSQAFYYCSELKSIDIPNSV